jgi:chromosome segregation and condensation protein ScpB
MGKKTLDKEVLSERALMELLGIAEDDRQQLDRLRTEHGLPCVKLGQRVRVYLVEEIREFVKSLAK